MNTLLSNTKKAHIILKSHSLLILIFLFALLLRTYGLSVLPNGVFTDEIVSGYVGRFILETGKDPYGNVFPLFYFNKIGDYRVILPMYLTGLTTYIFGLSIFSLRIVPAFTGALGVFPIFGIVKIFEKKKNISLFASVIYAILPWHIVLSRGQSEAVIALTVLLTGLYFFLQSSTRALTLSTLLFALTFFLYPTFRVVSPLCAWVITFAVPSDSRRKKAFAASLLTLLVVLLLQTTYGKGRFEQTSLFSDPKIYELINAKNSNYAQAHGPNKAFIARLFHNKITGYTREFLYQYADYLSPNFLFLTGGKPERYVIPEHGLVPISLGLLLLSGILYLASSPKKLFLTIGFILIGILPAAVTTDDVPNMHRSIFLMIPLIILASFGANFLFFKPQKKIVFIVPILILMDLITFWHHYFFLSPSYKSVLRGDGLWEGAEKLISIHNNYDSVVSTGFDEFSIYVMYRIGIFDKSLAGTFLPGLLRVPFVKNITFVGENCPKLPEKNESYKKILIVANGDCVVSPLIADEVDKVLRKDHTVALRFFIPK